MNKIRNGVIAATLFAVPIGSSALAPPAGAENTIGTPGVSVPTDDETSISWKEFRAQYTLCRSVGDPRWVCFLYALG